MRADRRMSASSQRASRTLTPSAAMNRAPREHREIMRNTREAPCILLPLLSRSCTITRASRVGTRRA
jgi:hypothetical protein